MLIELQIKDFAIFENASISFSEGLNIISGESGTGKSVLLKAINTVLGGKLSKNYLKGKPAELTLIADFRSVKIPDEDLQELLSRNELTIINRVCSDEVRQSRISINDKIVTLATLRKLAAIVVTESTQHESITLLNENNHLKILDAFGRIDTIEYQETYEEWQKKSKEIEEVDKKAAENLIKINTLQSLIVELEPLELEPNIREVLESKILEMTKARELEERFEELNELLLKGKSNAFAQLDSAVRVLKQLEIDDEKIDKFDRAVSELWSLAQEFSVESKFNEFELEEFREKLSDIARLERKYQSRDLYSLLNSARTSLDQVQSISVDALRKELAELRSKVTLLAKNISDQRQAAALELGALMSAELDDVGILGTEFIAKTDTLPLGSNGIDKVTFMLRRKGEDSRLSEVVSGGELSRVLLLFKKLVQDAPTLIFDEIDAGISGSVARKVGEKLKNLASSTQLIAISHLAQVSSLADQHILVRAGEPKVLILNLEERKRKIARMISGHEISEASLATASQLIV